MRLISSPCHTGFRRCLIQARKNHQILSLAPATFREAAKAEKLNLTSRQYRSAPSTHEVVNQVPPLYGVNHFELDKEAIDREHGQWARHHLTDFGALCGTEMIQDMATQANNNRPVLTSHDRYGNRIDTVQYHPYYHELMKIGLEWQVPSFAWNHPKQRGAHVARAALLYMFSQVDQGVVCPLTMTFAAVPALEHQPDIAATWVPRLKELTYDHRNVPYKEKAGCTVGMSMTEKQGGSDVRANTTVATPVDPNATGGGAEYTLVGHKWFTSAPMSDAFLTLAKTRDSDELSCFLVPRWLPEGSKNRGLQFQRLKDKLGDHSNASSEVEYHNAWGQMIGDEGKGVKTIIEMVTHTRLDCALGSAGIMRQAVVQAVHHAAHRKAFGRHLIEQPLMRNTLTDLALETEAATMMVFRVARAFDDAQTDSNAAVFCRIATAVTKYWLCKIAPTVVYEAMECHGGNGYVEDSILPRLYRQAPLNSIWEGSGNVICLDILRTLHKAPDALGSFLREVSTAHGINGEFDHHLSYLTSLFRGTDKNTMENNARRIVEALALALQSSLMLRYADRAAADAFVRSRLGGEWGRNYGTLPAELLIDSILQRITP